MKIHTQCEINRKIWAIKRENDISLNDILELVHTHIETSTCIFTTNISILRPG
jgi:hypothetical protein